jgi:hypothetical protein
VTASVHGAVTAITSTVSGTKAALPSTADIPITAVAAHVFRTLPEATSLTRFGASPALSRTVGGLDEVLVLPVGDAVTIGVGRVVVETVTIRVNETTDFITLSTLASSRGGCGIETADCHEDGQQCENTQCLIHDSLLFVPLGL